MGVGSAGVFEFSGHISVGVDVVGQLMVREEGDCGMETVRLESKLGRRVPEIGELG